MRAHDPNALHTKITAATPGGDCPLFQQVLARAQPDMAVREYLRRVAGYGLTGSSREHFLLFAYGQGRNGKGTLFHAIRHALGDYGLEVAPELLMESRNERHPTEIAGLRGARFVVGSEIDTGRRWNESRLKRLTGGDPIQARYIGRDMFEFMPNHTLVVLGNTKPGLRTVDEAIRARIHLVEFGVTIPEGERDTTLPDRLREEYAGILQWCLIGCQDWLERGLAPPESIRAATSEYLDNEDMIAGWIAECCVANGQVKLSDAYRSYRTWCEATGAAPIGRNTFGDQFEARGFKRNIDRNKAAVFEGISIKLARDCGDLE